MNVKTTVLLLGLLAVLAAGVFLMDDGNDAPKVSRALFDGFLVTDVTEISWSVGGGPATTVQRVDEGWVVLVAGMAVPASDVAVQDVLGELDRARVEKKIPAGETNATRKQQYLLAPPAHWVSFVMRGEIRKAFFGAPGQMRDTIYAQREKDDDVLLVDDGLVQTILELDSEELRSTDVLSWSVYDVGGVTVRGAEDTVVFEAVRDPVDSTLWQAKVPFTGYVDPQAMETDLLSGTLKLEATEFVKDGAVEDDLAAFGLAPARWKIVLSRKGNLVETRTVLIGSDVPDSVGFMYFMEQGKPFVYSGRRGNLLNILDGDPAAWRDRNITRLGWKSVDSFRIRFDSIDCEMERVHGDWHLARPERKLLAQEAIEEWFVRVRDLAADAFVDDPDLAALGLLTPRGELTFWPPKEVDRHGADEEEGEDAEPEERPEPVVRILIGAPVPDKDAVYVLRDGDFTTVYEAGRDLLDLIENGYYPFMQSMVFEDGLVNQNVVGITRSFDGKDVDLKADDGRWPEDTNTAALNGVVSKLLSLSAVRWVGPMEGHEGEYGLDGDLKLSLRIYVRNEDGAEKEFGVDIGLRAEDGFYARAWRDGEFEPDVFIVEKRMIEPVIVHMKVDPDKEAEDVPVQRGLQVPLTKQD